jgi:hypothetical protein
MIRQDTCELVCMLESTCNAAKLQTLLASARDLSRRLLPLQRGLALHVPRAGYQLHCMELGCMADS